jgi:hypothetical protein
MLALAIVVTMAAGPVTHCLPVKASDRAAILTTVGPGRFVVCRIKPRHHRRDGLGLGLEDGRELILEHPR